MRKYTHVKIVQENVDRAVGFIESLVSNNQSPVDYARNQAKIFYGLSAVESAIAMERYYEVTNAREDAKAEEYQPKPLASNDPDNGVSSDSPIPSPTPKTGEKAKAAK